MVFSSTRPFQLWDYHVSHNRLLLRSPASPEHPKNQDIIYYGVRILDIPTTFFGLDVDSVPPDGPAGTEEAPSVYTTFRTDLRRPAPSSLGRRLSGAGK